MQIALNFRGLCRFLGYNVAMQDVFHWIPYGCVGFEKIDRAGFEVVVWVAMHQRAPKGLRILCKIFYIG